VATAAGKRYARAIFELARESKDLDGWARRIQRVTDAVGGEETRRLLEDPSVPLEARVEAVEAATKGWDAQAKNLAKLLVDSGRLGAADDIASEYEALLDEEQGRMRAKATTAVELRPKDRDRLAEQLSRRFGRKVRLDVEVDPSILGGLVLQLGDHQIDASVATRLQQLRRRLSTA
jgi:F-type H+-transporting ATPase subunit delta